MTASLDEQTKQLLHAPNFCHVATLQADGRPHLTPVWVDEQDGKVVLNSAEGRIWVRNVARDPRVTLEISNSENPYQYVTITGRVVERTHDGADAHIDSMAKKYLGQDTYPYRTEGEQRVIFRVEPEKVYVNGR
jgi:PPOX class probable F420-dependent enzyme